MAIYLVTVQTDPAQTRIVDAPTRAGAINHVIKNLVAATPLSASEVVTHMQNGIKVEKVASETAAQPEPTTEKEGTNE